MTLNLGDIKAHRGQLVPFAWIDKERKPALYDSSIALGSGGETKAYTLRKEQVDTMMAVTNIEDFPLVVFGPQIVSLETVAERNTRNDNDAEAIATNKWENDDIQDFASQIRKCDVVTELRKEIDQQLIRKPQMEAPKEKSVRTTKGRSSSTS